MEEFNRLYILDKAHVWINGELWFGNYKFFSEDDLIDQVMQLDTSKPTVVRMLYGGTREVVEQLHELLTKLDVKQFTEAEEVAIFHEDYERLVELLQRR